MTKALIHLVAVCIAATTLLLQNTIQQSSPHAALGDPVRREQFIRRAGYDVLYDGLRHNPIWVQYRVTPDDLIPKVARPLHFSVDRMLPVAWRAYDIDYDHSGYDRGHMAPEADMRRNADVADSAMLLSNVCPQSPELNRNAWRDIEAVVRGLAAECEETIVITGPVFSSTHCAIGLDSGIVVPGAFWKAAAFRNGIGWRVRCWVAGQSGGSLAPDRLVVPQTVCEQLSGFELFSELKRTREAKATLE